MTRGIKIHKDVEGWLCGLGKDEFDQAVAALDLLAARGPDLGLPLVSPLYGRGRPGLRELRPKVGGKAEPRILFTFDPDGYAVLLEAGETVAWRGRHGRHLFGATVSGSPSLGRSRSAPAGSAPDAGLAGSGNASGDVSGRTYDSGFLCWDQVRDDLHVDEEAVARHKRRMRAEAGGHALAEIRRSRHLHQRDVATAMATRRSTVARIEDGCPGRLKLDTIRSYVEALGGELLVSAAFKDKRILLC